MYIFMYYNMPLKKKVFVQSHSETTFRVLFFAENRNLKVEVRVYVCMFVREGGESMGHFIGDILLC